MLVYSFFKNLSCINETAYSQNNQYSSQLSSRTLLEWALLIGPKTRPYPIPPYESPQGPWASVSTARPGRGSDITSVRSISFRRKLFLRESIRRRLPRRRPAGGIEPATTRHYSDESLRKFDPILISCSITFFLRSNSLSKVSRELYSDAMEAVNAQRRPDA